MGVLYLPFITTEVPTCYVYSLITVDAYKFNALFPEVQRKVGKIHC